MKTINPLFLILLYFTLTSFLSDNNDYRTKPENYPVKAIQLIENELSDSSILDTTYLLQFDYLEFQRKLAKVDEKYSETDELNFRNYFDYIYIKGLLNTLSDIEANYDDKDFKDGLLFKVRIQLKNRPISKEDMEFVFNHWDLDEIKDI